MSRIVMLLLLSVSAAAAPTDQSSLGPIANAGMQAKLGADGISTEGYASLAALGKSGPWQAEWITVPQATDAALACYRKEFVLEQAPARVVAWISADLQYRLYINGRIASRGPVDAGSDFKRGHSGYWFYDARDLTAFFHPGRNVVTVENFSVPFSASWRPLVATRGFIFEAAVTDAAGRQLVLKSDSSWRGLPGRYLQARSHPVFLGPQEPIGWKTEGFDDSAWSPCVAAADPARPALTASDVPPRLEARVEADRLEAMTGGEVSSDDLPFQHGHTVTLTREGSFVLRYRRILTGRVGLRVRGGAGAVVSLSFEETVEAKPKGGMQRSAELHLRDGVQEFEVPSYTSFTAVTVTVSHVTSPVEILDMGAEFQSYPVAYRGSFACSDAGLNRIWETARWGAQISMQDYHLDSADHQEPICDPGDYLIISLDNYNAFGDSQLARQDLRKFGRLLASEHYANFHTSYSLLWLQMLLAYYDYTGDHTLVAELAPQVHGLLDLFASYRGANGLISEARDYMFMDWVTIDGIACHHPPAVIGQGYMTAFYYRALADGIRVAELTGDPARAEQYRRLRTDVAAAFNRELWVPEKGLYRDGKPGATHVPPSKWLPADTAIETFSPHVNTLAVLYDLAPPAGQAAIIDQVMAAGPDLNTQPYFMHFVLAAIDHAGRFGHYGTPQLRRWKINESTQSFREMWQSGDYSHGWGGTPLYQLSSHVLGITPEAPGFAAISIRPEFCDLSWARGSVPTPHGTVQVDWRRSEGRVELRVVVPPGTHATVYVPTADADSVRESGGPVSGNPRVKFLRAASGSAVFAVADGTFAFEAKANLR